MPLLQRKRQFLLPQTHPIKQDIRNLHVITSYFNPCGYRRLRDNYWRFRDALNAPLHTIELCFGDREPEISDAVRVRTGTVIWAKESLLNILIDRLPPEVDAIAWIDADVIFDNPDWAEEACTKLRSYAVVQPWSKSWHQMPDGSLQKYKHSCASLFATGNKYWSNFAFATPGFAWAARADWLRRHRLADTHVIGGGDTAMLAAFTDRPLYLETRLSQAHRAHHDKWVRAVSGEVQRSLDYVPGNIRHLWHGYKADRNYIDRYQALASFDPERDLVRRPDGLWDWSAAASDEMVAAVRQHFLNRQEDREWDGDGY